MMQNIYRSEEFTPQVPRLNLQNLQPYDKTLGRAETQEHNFNVLDGGDLPDIIYSEGKQSKNNEK